MITINVKPAPGLAPAAAKLLKSDTGVGLLDSAGQVPEAGMPWPNGGLTLVLLRDGAILRADDPVFAQPKVKVEQPPAPDAPQEVDPVEQLPSPDVPHEAGQGAEATSSGSPATQPETATK